MLKFDSTVSITALLGICAIISPILTAIINNLYQIKLKKIELRRQEYRDATLHQRDLFDNYLHHAGRCIYRADSENLTAYGEAYFTALSYASGALRDDMIKANALIFNGNACDASPIIEAIAHEIHTIPKTL